MKEELDIIYTEYSYLKIFEQMAIDSGVPVGYIMSPESKELLDNYEKILRVLKEI